MQQDTAYCRECNAIIIFIRTERGKSMIDYDAGKPIAVTFAMNTAQGPRGFLLPACFEGTERVFQKQRIKIDREQIERTA